MQGITAEAMYKLGLAPLAFVWVGVIGLFMGSFLNCWAWRIVHNESILRGRSHCTSCGHVLGVLDLIPLFSWLASRGRCRYCGERISARYPITELICALAYVSIVAVHGLTLEALQFIGFASVLLVLTLTDLDEYYIPNGCIVAAVLVRLVYIVAAHFAGIADGPALLLQSVLGALAVGVPIVVLVLIMDRVLQRASMGGGDVKLLTVAGFYFGWIQCLFLLVLACIFGIVAAMVQMRAGQAGPADASDAAGDAASDGAPAAEAVDPAFVTIPWGPSIALACWATMLFARPFVDWYLSLFL